MRILPVLDVMHGQVVRGVAGERASYRPIVSKLTGSSEPLAVARAFRAAFPIEQLYLADLDALAGQRPNTAIYTQLQSEGFRLWIDAGLRTAAGAEPLLTAGVHKLIGGFESLAGPGELERLIQTASPERVVFSLDLKGGRLFRGTAAWSSTEPKTIAARAVDAGVSAIIVLDLARVGAGQGPGTEELCRHLVQTYPELRVSAGGGVRDVHDLQRLHALGVDAVLIASALHDGRLSRADLERFA